MPGNARPNSVLLQSTSVELQRNDTSHECHECNHSSVKLLHLNEREIGFSTVGSPASRSLLSARFSVSAFQSSSVVRGVLPRRREKPTIVYANTSERPTPPRICTVFGSRATAGHGCQFVPVRSSVIFCFRLSLDSPESPEKNRSQLFS